MAGKIFINYRRSTDSAAARVLFDRLDKEFRGAGVVMDVDADMMGKDYHVELPRLVAECDVFLAVIGKGWAAAKNEKGIGLEDPNDWVRIEIEAALAQDKIVIPVTAFGGVLPDPAELPETLRPLLRRDGARLTQESCSADVARIVAGIRARRRELRDWGAARKGGAAVVAVLAVIGLAGSGVVEEAIDRLRLVAVVTQPVIEPAPPPQPAPDRQTAPAKIVLEPAPAAITPPPPPCNGVTLAPLASRKPAPLSKDEECALKPKDEFQECEKCPVMVAVPAGRFLMGSPEDEKERSSNEGPQRRVRIAKPFSIGKFTVTFDEWDACVADDGCGGRIPDDNGWGRGRRPVMNVSWNDAKLYLHWLSAQTGKHYRLLSEAEWEYSARAGTKTPFWQGDTITTEQANYNGNYPYGGGEKGLFRARTVPVDSFSSNPFGLYQMTGNVWQWTEDCLSDYSDAANDGATGTGVDCTMHIARGGSWNDYAHFLRSASRGRIRPNYRYDGLGFRCARDHE